MGVESSHNSHGRADGASSGREAALGLHGLYASHGKKESPNLSKSGPDRAALAERLKALRAQRQALNELFSRRPELYAKRGIKQASMCMTRAGHMQELTVSLSVTEYDQNGFQASWSGWKTCRSWYCVNCADAQIEADRLKLAAFLVDGEARGLWPVMATYTIRHHAHMTAVESTNALGKAYDRMHSGRWYAEMREDLGIEESARSLECPTGPNGAHPHYHAIYLVDPAVCLSDSERSALSEAGQRAMVAERVKTYFLPRWLVCLQKLGYDASWEHGADFTAARSEVVNYIVKYGYAPAEKQWGAESEMVAGSKKKSRVGLSWVQLLNVAADLQDPDTKQAAQLLASFTGLEGAELLARASALYAEFAVAMAGRRQVKLSNNASRRIKPLLAVLKQQKRRTLRVADLLKFDQEQGAKLVVSKRIEASMLAAVDEAKAQRSRKPIESFIEAQGLCGYVELVDEGVALIERPKPPTMQELAAMVNKRETRPVVVLAPVDPVTLAAALEVLSQPFRLRGG